MRVCMYYSYNIIILQREIPEGEIKFIYECTVVEYEKVFFFSFYINLISCRMALNAIINNIESER